MAAARQRRSEKTERLLREARIQTVRGALRPGSTREEIREHARSLYPRLTAEILEQTVDLVCSMQRTPASSRSAG
jgi:alkylhydroperoxidase/carboxymuconolactone decarboxylase family protein YurZ